MIVEELYNNVSQKLERFARSLSRNADDAEDLVQETFTRALANAELLDLLSPGKRRAWLFTVLRNCWTDARRRKKFEARLEWSVEPAQEDVIDSRVERMEVSRLVARLPRNLRDCVFKRYVLGLNSTEIARDLSVPAATVRYRLHTARKLMRREITRRETSMTFKEEERW